MLMLAVVLAGAGMVAQAADRGLALTIGAPRGQAPLPGVRHDTANAASLYTRLGFDGAPRQLGGTELPMGALRGALDQLVRDTRPGDRVFLYFSGYGTALASGGACTPTWLAHDGRALPPADLARTVQALNARAGQLVMVVDASAAPPKGGLLPRGAKSARRADACAQAGPWLAGTPAPGADDVAAKEGATVLLAASRAGGHAFDDPAGGGVATQALLACLAQPGFARNPLAAFDDLHDCTRERVAAAGRAQHTVLAGNAGLPVQPELAAMVPPSADLGRDTPVAALQRAVAHADARWGVRAVPAAREAGAVSVTSDRDGFLYIVRAGAEASDLSLVYPQRAGEPNRLRAGQGFEVPRPADAGSAPPDRLMVLVSDRPWRSGDLLVSLGLAHYAAAACLRNLGSDDCPSPSAGAGDGAAALHFGATLLSADGQPVVTR